MTEVHIGWQVGPGTGGDDRLLEVQRLGGLATPDFYAVLVDKKGPAVYQIHAIARVELRPELDLLADDLLGILKHSREREPARLPDIPEHLVGVERNDLFDGVAQRLGRNGAPVGAVPANGRLVFDDRDTFAVFRRIHRRAFAGRTGADNDDVVMMFCHARSDSLSTS